MDTPAAATRNPATHWLTDLAVPVGIVTIVMMMVLPIPAILIDMLLAVSLAVAIAVFLIGLFMEQPLEFSAFPAVVLVATLLRLSVNVASTRLILLHGAEGHGAAGQVIETFGRLVVGGLGGTLAGAPPESGAHSSWAQRSIKAHTNAVENLAIFAPAVLIAYVLNISTPATKVAVVVYFFARLLHFLVYSAGIPAARTLTFTAGWLAQVAIIASILRWV